MKYSYNYKYVFDISIIGIYSALVFGLQVVLFFIPNVELVTLLISFAAIIFSFKKSILISLIFCFLEGIYYGFADWFILYLIVWPSLVLIAYILKKTHTLNWFSFILLNTLFGLLFGTVDAFIKMIMLGNNEFVFYTYWVKGLIFDLIHGCSNFLIAYFLYKPLMQLYETNLKGYL